MDFKKSSLCSDFVSYDYYMVYVVFSGGGVCRCYRVGTCLASCIGQTGYEGLNDKPEYKRSSKNLNELLPKHT